MKTELEQLRDENIRLLRALDHIARVALGARNRTKRIVWIFNRAKSAISNDESWLDVEKPHGYHDATERA